MSDNKTIIDLNQKLNQLKHNMTQPLDQAISIQFVLDICGENSTAYKTWLMLRPDIQGDSRYTIYSIIQILEANEQQAQLNQITMVEQSNIVADTFKSITYNH